MRKRFADQFRGASAVAQEALRENARALNGTKPGRTNRDPALIKRNRKALTK